MQSYYLKVWGLHLYHQNIVSLNKLRERLEGFSSRPLSWNL